MVAMRIYACGKHSSDFATLNTLEQTLPPAAPGADASLAREPVDSKQLERGCGIICAGLPFFGLGLEDCHVPNFWLLLYRQVGARVFGFGSCRIRISAYGVQAATFGFSDLG